MTRLAVFVDNDMHPDWIICFPIAADHVKDSDAKPKGEQSRGLSVSRHEQVTVMKFPRTSVI